MINYVNTYLICCGSGQFYSVLLHWLSGKYQPFQFGNGKDFIYSLEIFFFLQCCLCFKDGRLRTGDHILQIGGTNVQGMTSEQVAQVLRNCGNSVRMIVARDPKCEITDSPPAPVSWPVSTLPPFQNGSVST